MDKFTSSSNKEEKKYVLCSMCKGTGLCEQENPATVKEILFDVSFVGDFYEKKAGNRAEQLRSDDPTASSQQGICQDLASMMKNCLDDEKNDHNPPERLILSMQKLKKNQPEQNLSALKNILFLSRDHPELVEPVVPIVYRKLASLLQSSKYQVVGLSAHLTAQFFKVTQYARRPEFDELATAVLQKTAHTNKHVREISIDALECMVSYLPYAHCVRVLTSSRGAGHKNPEVRAAVSRLLENVVKAIGEKTFLNAPHLKDTRCKIFTALAQFLIDGNRETRTNATKQVKHFFTDAEFEKFFQKHVDLKLYGKVEKEFLALKFEETEKSDSL